MKLFKSISSILLALLVLVSSSSFMVSMHFCGGHVKSFSLIEKATPCALEVQAPCHKRMAIKKSACCNDKEVAFEGKNFNSKVHSPATNISPSIAVLPLILEVAQINVAQIASNHNSYKPPAFERDIPVLMQSFLI